MAGNACRIRIEKTVPSLALDVIWVSGSLIFVTRAFKVLKGVRRVGIGMALLWALGTALCCSSAQAATFRLPTSNRAIFQTEGSEDFYVGTVGKPWTSGTFGCVRSEGTQLHEGIDIRCLERDRHGEPVDPVWATADGTVVYLNERVGLSNYGRYIILRHRIEGLEIYSIYAHLREIAVGLRLGAQVRAGQAIGVLGRSSNTRQQISRERAHLHFEINLFVNERFPAWYQKTFPGQRNDHGKWNGQNLLGLDPTEIFLAQQREGDRFSLLGMIRSQSELCRVVVRDTEFAWLKSYTPLIKRNALAEREGVVGYELALNFNGIAFQLIPRAESEIPGSAKVQLLSVNEAERRIRPCRQIVVKRGQKWELGATGKRLVDLLTF